MLFLKLFNRIIEVFVKNVCVMGAHKDFMWWVDQRLINWDPGLLEHLHPYRKHIHSVHYMFVFIPSYIIFVLR